MQLIIFWNAHREEECSSSVEIMKKHGIEKIISFDSDFDKVNDIDRIH